MRESRVMEFKESVSTSFLKTVSAYANYGTGQILFGVDDDGTARGLQSPRETCLDIENRINDSLDPVPRYTLSVDETTGVITLTVYEGPDKPYLYKAKAYRRADTATVPVDRTEMTRLILQGRNSSYEELPSQKQDLTFVLLEERIRKAMNLSAFTLDMMKTLEIYHEGEGYNNAAALLSDRNDFCGVDIVRFGDSTSILLDRETIEHVSILSQFDQALAMYRKYYQYERITGSDRAVVKLIPEEACREAIANALVHRAWDINAHINVSMFADRIEITSPGDLPAGIDPETYLRGGISVPRNRIVAGIFYRLRLIEQFGTGIRRINEAYAESLTKPQYALSENTIRITLPVIQRKTEMTADEYTVYRHLTEHPLSSSALSEATGFGKSKVIAILKRLLAHGCVRITGSGRGTKYTAV